MTFNLTTLEKEESRNRAGNWTCNIEKKEWERERGERMRSDLLSLLPEAGVFKGTRSDLEAKPSSEADANASDPTVHSAGIPK